MNARKFMLGAAVELSLACGIWTVAPAGAEATIVFSQPNAEFSAAPYTISFGDGAATYTFTDIFDPSIDPLTVAAVSTGGSALVDSFFGQPSALQLGSVVGATGDEFAPFATSTGIPFSIAEDSIGLEFSLADGIHHGFITTLGPEVIKYAFNTTPGGLITVGAPEPASWVLLIVGFGILGIAAGARAVRKSTSVALR